MRWTSVFLSTLPAIIPVGPATPITAAQTGDSPAQLPADHIMPQPKATPSSLVVEQSVDGLFYVRAEVNHTPVDFVVDTGSSVVILNAADAARARVDAAAAVAVDTAGGAASMRRAHIDRVDFAGQTMSGVDAAIVKRDLKVSLLGQSVLSRLNAVTFKGDRLELH